MENKKYDYRMYLDKYIINYPNDVIKMDGKNIWMKGKKCWTNIITNKVVLFKSDYDEICFYKDTILFILNYDTYSWNIHTRKKTKLISNYEIASQYGVIRDVYDMRMDYGILYYMIQVSRTNNIIVKFNLETSKLELKYIGDEIYRNSFKFKLFNNAIYHIKHKKPSDATVILYINDTETDYKNIKYCCDNSKYYFCIIDDKLFRINLLKGTSINISVAIHAKFTKLINITDNYLILQYHEPRMTYLYNMRLQLVYTIKTYSFTDTLNNYYFNENVRLNPHNYSCKFYKFNSVILNTIKNKCRNNNYYHILRLF